jgi:hypothetical protein
MAGLGRRGRWKRGLTCRARMSVTREREREHHRQNAQPKGESVTRELRKGTRAEWAEPGGDDRRSKAGQREAGWAS